LWTTGGAEINKNDNIFDFTNKFVMAASQFLPAFVIKAAINRLDKMGEEGIFCTSEAHRTTAINVTMPILHPECILEWVHALDLRISTDKFKSYARQMQTDGDLTGAAILITHFKF